MGAVLTVATCQQCVAGGRHYRHSTQAASIVTVAINMSPLYAMFVVLVIALVAAKGDKKRRKGTMDFDVPCIGMAGSSTLANATYSLADHSFTTQ